MNKMNTAQDSMMKEINQRGAVFVEFILVLPVLLALVLVLFDLGQRQYYATLFSASAERAASYAAVVPNLEYVNVGALDGEQVIIDTKERALSMLRSSGIAVHLGAWSGGADFSAGENGSPPAWVWINDIQVILPVDPDGNKTLTDMLASEPIILELEGFYARTLTGFGPSRIHIRRATYREMSQNISNPLGADGDRPCPGAIDNRYGFANGACYCRLDNTGLTDVDGGCDCANQLQTYNQVSGKCECPGAPANSVIDPVTCQITCLNMWTDTDGDGSCESCQGPFTSTDPITGGCSCSTSQRNACLQIPGSFNTNSCACTKCPGSDGIENRFATNGTCACKPASQLCPDSRMTVNRSRGCQCECPNVNFEINASGRCECTAASIQRLIDTQCGAAQFVNTLTCSCTNCAQAGATRADGNVCQCAPCLGGTFKAGNDSSTQCAQCISCDASRFDGDFVANPNYPEQGGNPCICPLNCDGENEYLNEVNNGAAGGTCECLSCQGRAVANEENSGCFCDTTSLYNECVLAPGPDGQREFDPATACDCGAPCGANFAVDLSTGKCVCPAWKESEANCPEGTVWRDEQCGCVSVCDRDGETDDYDGEDGCYCDHDSMRDYCHNVEQMPYDESSCSCRGNCADIDSSLPYYDPTTRGCYCDKDRYIEANALDCEGKVWNQDSCRCGTAACTGRTPDYSEDDYSCVCNKDSRMAACGGKEPPESFDDIRCDCGDPCVGDSPDIDGSGNCHCNASARRVACLAHEPPLSWNEQNCTCGGNCEEQEGVNDWAPDGSCTCNRSLNAQNCADLEPPQQINSNCGCGGTCGGATPDLIDGYCTCNRNWANGNGENNACASNEYFDDVACRCNVCGAHAAPGSDANHSCECDSSSCPLGMIAESISATACECVCPEGTEEVAGNPFANKCMPLWCNRGCIWQEGEWRNPGTE